MKSNSIYVHIPTQRIGNNSSYDEMLALNMNAGFEFDLLHSACMKHDWGKKTVLYVYINHVFVSRFLLFL